MIIISKMMEHDNMRDKQLPVMIANPEVQRISDRPKTASWRKFMVGPIICLYTFCYMISFSNMSLYGPYYIGITLFPNGTTGPGGKSMCDVNATSQGFKDFLKIQDYTSRLNIYFTLASGIPAILANIFLGTFSDHFGRKFIFIVPMVGFLIKNIICCVGVYYSANYLILLAGYFIEGLSGILFSLLQVSFSYVSDLTTKGKERSLGITVIEISIGIGAVFGGFTTGYLVRAVGFVWPMAIACGLMILDIFLVVTIVPETLDINKESKSRSCSDIINYIKTVFSFYVEKNPKNHRWRYNICILIFTLTTLTVMGRSTVETLYQLSSPLCWESVKIGWFSSVKTFAQNVVGMALVKVFQVCMNDELIAITGTISSIAGFVMEGFAKSDIYMYMVTVVGAGGVLTLPMMRAIMSKMTPEDRQGAMFGGVAAVETACNMCGSIISNAIYGRTVGISRGFVFFVFAMFCTAALILLIIMTIIRKCQPSENQAVRVQNNPYKPMEDG